jgi:putative DNA primase/helicase
MVAAVAAAFMPNGISAPGVLTLQGAQYLGKTKWFKTLVPSEMDLIQEGMILKPDDKDSVKQCTSYWLVELGELDSTFRKSDIAQLKAFITKQVDVLRLAYARRESRFPRRTMFFGSVNPREFLHDATGNRRFWTIECQHINHDHGLSMQQVWAEVHTLWQSGESYYLSADEMDALNAHNSDFMGVDPIEERVLDALDWSAPTTVWRWAQASTVLIECGIDRPTKADTMTASTLIRAKNGDQSRRGNGQRLVLCPPKAYRK